MKRLRSVAEPFGPGTSNKWCGCNPAPLLGRIWTKTVVAGPDECWLWCGATSGGGYPVTGVKNRTAGYARTLTVSRMVYSAHRGEIPAGQVVRHRCDNPLCVNPAHFELGTHGDNMADRTARGRAPKGADNPSAKLDVDDVRLILHSDMKHASIAKLLGVSPGTVKGIRQRRSWKWLEASRK